MDRIPLKTMLKWTAYPAFFFLCFVFFAYKTFPYEKLADRLVQEAAARGYELEIIDLTHSGLTGLTFENVRVVLPPEGEDSTPLDVIFDELTVGTSLFALISGARSYSFDAELAGGELEGDINMEEESMELDVEIEELDLGAIPALRRFTKVPLRGILDGEIELAVPAELAESTGNIDVSIESFKVGDGKTKIDIPGWGGLTLDEADVGTLELVVPIEEGVAMLETAKAHGTDLKLDALGKVRLLRPLKRSDLNVLVRVKIEDAYKERSAKVATMLELASSGLKSAMTTDGAIQYQINGAISGRIRPRAAGRQAFQAPK